MIYEEQAHEPRIMGYKFYDSPEGFIMVQDKGLFIDAECPCQRSTLYEYVIIHYDHDVDTPADFIRQYHCYPQAAERMDPIIKFDRDNGINQMHIGARIKAFTIADAFRLIRQRAGEVIRPNHKVLEFDSSAGIFVEISPCRFVLKSTIVPKTESEAADMFQQMRANLERMRSLSQDKTNE